MDYSDKLKEQKISPQTTRIALSEFTSCVEYMTPEAAMSRAISAALDSEGFTIEKKLDKVPYSNTKITGEYRYVGLWRRL
jgi:hypothetical protein